MNQNTDSLSNIDIALLTKRLLVDLGHVTSTFGDQESQLRASLSENADLRRQLLESSSREHLLAKEAENAQNARVRAEQALGEKQRAWEAVAEQTWRHVAELEKRLAQQAHDYEASMDAATERESRLAQDVAQAQDARTRCEQALEEKQRVLETVAEQTWRHVAELETRLDERARDHKASMDAATAREWRLAQDVAEAQDARARLEQALVTKERGWETAVEQTWRHVAEMEKRLEQQARDHKASLDAATERESRLVQDVSQAQDARKRAEQALGEKQRDLETVVEKTWTHVAELERRLAEREEQVRDYEASMDAATGREWRLAQDFAEAQDAHTRFEHALAEKKRVLETVVEHTWRHVADTEKRLAEREVQARAHKASMDAATERESRLVQDVAEAQDERARSERALVEKKHEWEMLVEQTWRHVAELEKRIVSLEGILAERDALLHAATERESHLAQQLADAQDSQVRCEQMLAEKKRELEVCVRDGKRRDEAMEGQIRALEGALAKQEARFHADQGSTEARVRTDIAETRCRAAEARSQHAEELLKEREAKLLEAGERASHALLAAKRAEGERDHALQLEKLASQKVMDLEKACERMRAEQAEELTKKSEEGGCMIQ